VLTNAGAVDSEPEGLTNKPVWPPELLALGVAEYGIQNCAVAPEELEAAPELEELELLLEELELVLEPPELLLEELELLLDELDELVELPEDDELVELPGGIGNEVPEEPHPATSVATSSVPTSGTTELF
jgi:hypothetical protein